MRKCAYFSLFVFVVIWRDVIGENIRAGGDDLCAADVTVGLERKVIRRFKKETFQIYCKLHDGFQSIELKVKGEHRVRSLNFSAQMYNFSVDSIWQPLYVKLDYEYNIRVAYHWLLTVSLNQKELRRGFLDWGYIYEDLLSMELIAFGQSEWRFAKPGEDCTDLEGTSVAPGPDHNSLGGKDSGTLEQPNVEKNLWILVGVVGAAVIIGVFGIAILLYKIRHPKVIVLPRVNLETENENEYQLPLNATGDGCLVTRPGSAHDSENSLYGVL